MSSAKQFFRPIVTLLLIAITVMGLLNVYGDASEVVALAERIVCDGSSCPTRTTRIERTPFSHEYDLVATRAEGTKSRTVSATVRCSRAYVLVGAWSCASKQ